MNFPGTPVTARERQVLLLLCDGASNAQIAHAFGISPETVAKHITSLKHKLDARNRSEAVAIAIRRGIAEADPEMRPVVIEVVWRDGGRNEVEDLLPRYLGAEAYRRYSGFRQILDRPYPDWLPDWYERFSPLIDAISRAQGTDDWIEVDGVRFVIPGTEREFLWSALLQQVNGSRYVFRIQTPLP